MSIREKVRKIAKAAKQASRLTATLEASTKHRILLAMAKAIEKKKRKITDANEKDLKAAEKNGLSMSFVDRLKITEKRIKDMASSIEEVAGLKDPVGRVLETVKRPNGLLIKRVSVPIGVIGIIYESRPNVTADCLALCLKAGNSAILRGGSEAINSNIAIFDALNDAAAREGLPENALNLIKDTDRRAVRELLLLDEILDLIIPRGGESLIKEVVRLSRIPVIKHYKGVCHVYVDEYADLDMAKKISLNAKLQKPGVCNAMETLLVHRKVAGGFLPDMIKRFKEAGVQIRGCRQTKKIVKNIKTAKESDWSTEYLDLILSVKVVRGVEEAIEHIEKYGSMHSDTIVTGNSRNAAKFLKKVDSSCVYHNASTRFTDGNQFGKGAEIGISTSKLHARGPMGAEELCTYKYIVFGQGQTRI